MKNLPVDSGLDSSPTVGELLWEETCPGVRDPLTRWLLRAFSEREVLSVRALGRFLTLSLTDLPNEPALSRISSPCTLVTEPSVLELK